MRFEGNIIFCCEIGEQPATSGQQVLLGLSEEIPLRTLMASRMRLLRATLFSLSCFAANMPAAFAEFPDEWKKGAYAYSAESTPLTVLLADFAETYGVVLDMEPLEERLVSGKFRAESAQDFISRFAIEYNFQWFVYNDTLYISPQSMQTSRRFEITTDSALDTRQALKGIGLLDPRFGWGVLPSEGTVLVSGPPRYIELIEGFIKKITKPAELKEEVMVFPLKYASVADRTIKYREQTLTIPGVVTLLNELFGLGNVPSAAGSEDLRSGPGKNMANRAQAESNNVMTQMVSRNNHFKKEADSFATSTTFSADIRNNSVLVRDDSRRRQEYSALIASLDKPQKLVRIDAVFIDIDRDELNRLSADLAGKIGNIVTGSSMAGGATNLFLTNLRSFMAKVQALEGKGSASIVANPSVLTLENQPAIIDFNNMAFVTAIGERVAEIKTLTAGTSLRVTPRVMTDKVTSPIQLIIDIDDGKIKEDDDGKAKGTKNASLSTQAPVDTGRSLVIGGFNVAENGDHTRRIPVLGSIPLIGTLFRSTQQEASRRERIFIITPHLIGDQDNPSRYVKKETAPDVAEHPGISPAAPGDKKQLITDIMLSLINHRVPANMSAEKFGPALSAFCEVSLSFAINNENTKWYKNENMLVLESKISNYLSAEQKFNIKNCNNPRILGASLWPNKPLKSGESAKIYLVVANH
jgi:type III secretion protein C